MEDTQKAINLFKFIKGLNELKRNTIENVDNQLWSKTLASIPESKYIHKFRYGIDDEINPNNAIISVQKPKFDPCPKPDDVLLQWLEVGWNDFEKNGDYKAEILVKELNENNEEIEKVVHFSDSEERVRLYNEWIEKRQLWRSIQIDLNKIRTLFSDLALLHFELKANSETEEMIVADGFLLDRDNDNINHPVLSRRIKTEFDEDKNIVSIINTDEDSELYISMLSRIDGLNNIEIGNLNNSIKENDYHPLDTEVTVDFLKRLAHLMSTEAEFSENGIPNSWKQNSRFLIYKNPVIIVRKKLDGSLKAIESIIENIEEKGFIPQFLKDIISGGTVELPEEQQEETIDQKLAAVGGEDVDIFLSKEANREQLEIARRIEKYNAVLVQGPPGTGKTHTIANLLGHFLAQGKSVLITSHTSKALTVLKDKISPEIRDLCVSVLEDNKEDMERSVEGINDRLGRYTSRNLKKEMDSILLERKKVISDLAKTRKQMFELINQEYNSIVINGEEITPIEAAKYIVENENLSYIPGRVRSNYPLPVSFDELTKLYRSNEFISVNDEKELKCDIPNPNILMSPTELEKCWNIKLNFDKSIKDIENETNWRISYDSPNQLIYLNTNFGEFKVHNEENKIKELKNFVFKFEEFEPWMLNAAVDGKKGKAFSNRWIILKDQIQKTVTISEEFVSKSFGFVIEDSGLDKIDKVKDTLYKIKEKMSSSHKISKIDRMFDKKIDSVLNIVKINGNEISNVSDIELIIKKYELQENRDICNKYWNDLIVSSSGPEFYSLDNVYPENIANKWASTFGRYLNWCDKDYEILKDLLQSVLLDTNIIFEVNNFDSEEKQIEKQLSAITSKIKVVLDICDLCAETIENNTKFSKQIEELEIGNRVNSEICLNLLNATKNGNIEEYTKYYGDLTNLFNKYSLLKTRNDLLKIIDPVAHEWADAIVKREGIHGEFSVPSTIEDAWKWKQYSQALSELLSKSYDVLQKKALDLSKKYREVTTEYATKSAWFYLIQRTETNLDMRQDLNAWQQSVKKIGKGHGKFAAEHRAAARRYMKGCQKAVPAWIMTVNKALETLDPKENRFDIIIIDEASQSDLSSMAILYMAKKIIIVGDDKQVSPLAVGMQLDDVRNLALQYIGDSIKIANLFEPRTSIYDIAKTTFQPLMLKEHFRCVPEIINYSNMISYDWKIMPLRDANSTPILPATVDYRVKGVRENETNVVEKDTIVALIKSCCDQPEYNGKTFGVISMLKDNQAKEIDRKLFEELGPKEYKNRKILCGTSANFQGDERDVVFISLVASNEPNKGPMTTEGCGVEDANKKRFNVAVSRARDQIWVIHSMDENNDLKSGDLRKQLIDYVKNPKMFEIDQIAKKADSPFEVEVVSGLRNRGYHVVQQWPVGSYRLDMVVIYNDKKIVIECDGERYHGPEKIAEDMERQTICERIGWRFIRLRGSEYYVNKSKALERIINDLNEKGIYPESSEIIERRKDTELLSRVKIGAAKYLDSIEDEEPIIDTIAAALNEKENFDSKSHKNYVQLPLQNDSIDESEKNLDESVKIALYEDNENKTQENHTIDIQQKTESKQAEIVEEEPLNVADTDDELEENKTFDVLLKENGFDYIDNRTTSNLIWIIGSEEDKEKICSCLKGLNYKAMNFEKRGAYATSGKPAWLISFNGGNNGKRS
jgi:very-short-patch-repair endonuclease